MKEESGLLIDDSKSIKLRLPVNEHITEQVSAEQSQHENEGEDLSPMTKVYQHKYRFSDKLPVMNTGKMDRTQSERRIRAESGELSLNMPRVPSSMNRDSSQLSGQEQLEIDHFDRLDREEDEDISTFSECSERRQRRMRRQIREITSTLDNKFKSLSVYQDLVQKALEQVVEKEVLGARRNEKKDPPMPRKKSLIKSSSLMISRDEALKQLDNTSMDDSLPEVLQKNNINAEPILFKEAQVNYAKRRRTI